ncbi:unnamed protein product [Spirodela intermedia]|uniref:Uncharacterized protein n=1 Tax=Spirodela intermedia TaxID=51605 RepID=A0A7I8LIQ2_SPIIN|nr:unnamed protein product [Spirodela intermedia]
MLSFVISYAVYSVCFLLSPCLASTVSYPVIC